MTEAKLGDIGVDPFNVPPPLNQGPDPDDNLDDTPINTGPPRDMPGGPGDDGRPAPLEDITDDEAPKRKFNARLIIFLLLIIGAIYYSYKNSQ